MFSWHYQKYQKMQKKFGQPKSAQKLLFSPKMEFLQNTLVRRPISGNSRMFQRISINKSFFNVETDFCWFFWTDETAENFNCCRQSIIIQPDLEINLFFLSVKLACTSIESQESYRSMLVKSCSFPYCMTKGRVFLDSPHFCRQNLYTTLSSYKMKLMFFMDHISVTYCVMSFWYQFNFL